MNENIKDRTAHWGTCSDEDCLTSVVIYPHADAVDDLPEEDLWGTHPLFLSCPVCGESIDFGGTDHPSSILKNY